MLEVISIIERLLEKKAVVKKMPFQKSDVEATWPHVSKATSLVRGEPEISLETGLGLTVDSYRKNRDRVHGIQLNTGYDS